MGEPTRTAFDRELAELDSQVVLLAAEVCEALGATAEALSTGEHDVAADVVDRHQTLDAGTRRCESRAFEVLARQQPAAGDLRLLVTVIRLTHELERSAKLVKHVAAFAARPRSPLPVRVGALIGRMAREAHQLFQGAIEAYVSRDVAQAEALDVWDDRLDDLHRRLLGELFAEPLALATTIELVLVGRYFERVADHAVLVGERVRYLVTGEL
ncbi:MAG TPA: phosphate signaling complex protein PhoU [Acidimicrobiales bacterium]|nr:phosphate signaling complex protein PhoU [Acidimicrobiales bacterium]